MNKAEELINKLGYKVVDRWKVGYSKYATFKSKNTDICISYNEKAPVKYVASYIENSGFHEHRFITSGNDENKFIEEIKRWLSV